MIMRFLRYLVTLSLVGMIVVFGGATAYVSEASKDLPNYAVLEKYEPPVMTRFHAADGGLMAEFATNRRLYLPIQSVPDLVREAFISAEDKNFFSHFGLDPEGLARALVNNAKNIGSGRRPEGASTITQQVAKNFLLTSDATLQRKVKEAILSLRIEKAYSKEHILELYLNEIYLGRGAYGIAAAALTYFNKSVGELALHEVAYLAALPKGPGNYDPFKFTDRALDRRNWVIGRMVENGYVTEEEAQIAKQKPLDIRLRGRDSYIFAADYFTEEVRRQLVARYGSTALYEGGLSVRTTLDPQTQKLAREALQRGLIKFDQNYGWRGAWHHLDIGGYVDWGVPLAEIEPLLDVPEWQLAVVLGTTRDGVQIGLQPSKTPAGQVVEERVEGEISARDMKWAQRVIDARGRRQTVKNPSEVFARGDVVFVEKKAGTENGYLLRQPPKVQGALVAMEPLTGRILAMVGGFSYAQSEFNRATQAAWFLF